MRVFIRYLAFLYLALIITGCKPLSESSLAVDDSTAVAPPPRSEEKFVAGDISSLVTQSGPRKAGPEAADTLFPDVKKDATEWFTGDKKSYYLPTADNESMWQHFDEFGQRTGWVFDKKSGQMGLMKKGVFDFKTAEQVYDMTYDPQKFGGGWQGVQQIFDAKSSKYNPTGLSFYNANMRDPGNLNADPRWTHLWQVDTNNYNNNELKQFLADNRQISGGNALFTQSPIGWNGSTELQAWDGKMLDSLFVTKPNPVVQATPPPAQQNTDTVSVPIFGNLPATKNGKQLVIVSAKDCGVCNQNHSAFVATGARVDYLESMSEDPRGGRSFPPTLTV